MFWLCALHFRRPCWRIKNKLNTLLMVQLVNFHSNLRCTICTVSFVFTLDTLITDNFLVVLGLGDITSMCWLHCKHCSTVMYHELLWFEATRLSFVHICLWHFLYLIVQTVWVYMEMSAVRLKRYSHRATGLVDFDLTFSILSLLRVLSLTYILTMVS